LFDILSSSSSADHPLCDECTDSLLLLMDQQLRMTEGEWSDYNEYLKKLEIEQQYQGHEDVEMENLTKELQDVKAEEERMIRELEALRKEEIATRNAIAEQEREKERLEISSLWSQNKDSVTSSLSSLGSSLKLSFG